MNQNRLLMILPLLLAASAWPLFAGSSGLSVQDPGPARPLMDQSWIDQADPAVTAPDADIPLEEPASSSVLFPKPSLTGQAFLGFEQYFQNNSLEPNSDYFFDTILDLNLSGRIGDSLLYVVTPRLQHHSGNRVDARFEFLEQNELRPLFTFQEAYLEYTNGGFSLVVGKQIFSWGVADAYRPTDIVNPTDNLIVPDRYKIGVPATTLRYSGELGAIEAILIPWFTPSRVPEPTDRWSPSIDPLRRALYDAVGFNPDIVYPSREFPSNSIEKIQAGLRLSSSSLIKGWDLALNYFRGYQPLGVYKGDIYFGGLAPSGVGLSLTREYPEFHMAGGSFSTTWDDFEFHGEAAWHQTVDDVQDDDYVSYITGFNYHWNRGLPTFLDRATIVVEYAGEQVTHRRPPTSRYISTGVDRGLTNSVVSTIRLEFLQETRLETSAAYNFNGGDYAVGTFIAKKFFDRLDCKIGADFLWGDDDTFFGSWARNDRVYSSMTLNF